ncbi:MAG: hypothetical protein IJT96_00985 [Lachnospiraceae bacterium]|nr:hypothetical protein [Lachnospiraceae bacterium]
MADNNKSKHLHLYIEELDSLPSYTDDEIYEAKTRAIAGDDKEAEAVLMNHYLKDVVDMAKLYEYQEIPAEDLIGEGNIGLMTAIRALTTLESPDEVDSFVGKMIMDAMDQAVYEEIDMKLREEGVDPKDDQEET